MNLKRTRRRATSLAEWRDRADIGQREAAAKFGISQPYWCLLEQGQRVPRPKLAQRLSAETGVPLETILGLAS